jgi:hypothetical protein
MKYRVRIDFSYASEADARRLLDFSKSKTGAAVNINAAEGEISFCELELCGHDEGNPCTILERVEINEN